MKNRIILIGNGSTAVACLKVLHKLAPTSISLVLAKENFAHGSADLVAFAHSIGLPGQQFSRLSDSSIISKIREISPSLIFSINNFSILGRDILEICPVAINFHNSLLPKYRGANPCTWAIYHGEKEHGVSWHRIEESIDTGSLLAQQRFPIEPTDTVAQVLVKSLRVGVQCFQENVPRWLDGQTKGTAQSEQSASYFTRRQIPNDGIIDFSWSYEKLDRFFRSLSFHPLPNPLVVPKWKLGRANVLVEKCERVGEHCGEIGIVRKVSQAGIEITTFDSIVRLSHFQNENGEVLDVQKAAAQMRIEIGTQLTRSQGEDQVSDYVGGFSSGKYQEK